MNSNIFLLVATLLSSCTLMAGDIAFVNMGKAVDNNPMIIALHKELNAVTASDQSTIRETAAKFQSKVDEAVAIAAKELGEGIPTYSSPPITSSSQKFGDSGSKSGPIDLSSLMNAQPLPSEFMAKESVQTAVNNKQMTLGPLIYPLLTKQRVLMSKITESESNLKKDASAAAIIIAQKRGYKHLINSCQCIGAVLWSDGSDDITDDVIKALNTSADPALPLMSTTTK